VLATPTVQLRFLHAKKKKKKKKMEMKKEWALGMDQIPTERTRTADSPQLVLKASQPLGTGGGRDEIIGHGWRGAHLPPESFAVTSRALGQACQGSECPRGRTAMVTPAFIASWLAPRTCCIQRWGSRAFNVTAAVVDGGVADVAARAHRE
jgi:hypothetical protein